METEQLPNMNPYELAVELLEISKRERHLGNYEGASELTAMAQGVCLDQLEAQKRALNGIGRLIRESYSDGTKPKARRYLKKVGKKIYKVREELRRDLIDFAEGYQDALAEEMLSQND